jgi:5-methylcytosine-specific restriction endonuclease McrA
MSGEPFPKSRQLARGQKRYRRKVASPKQWQAISAAKVGPCRVCGDPGKNGRMYGRIQLHHVVPREDGGDDVADNIVPLCPDCHQLVTGRAAPECRVLVAELTDAEYTYAVEKAEEQVWERVYGITYERAT